MYTHNGFICSVEIILVKNFSNDEGFMDGISKTTSDKSKKTNSDTRKDIMEFHKKIEHHNIKITKTTVYIYNITLVGGDLDK